MGLAWAALALVGATTACATGSGTGSATGSPTEVVTSTATQADATTQRIAEVEFGRQCTVGTTSYTDEAAFTTDLDDRLAAAGFTHEQWKQWHDALADSPELATQFAAISAAGCLG